MKSIPDVKALIRTLNYAQCVEIANKALTFATAGEVEKLVFDTFNI
jgi:phosphoenolpyruvate-protein kinase (PTS system EI component)